MKPELFNSGIIDAVLTTHGVSLLTIRIARISTSYIVLLRYRKVRILFSVMKSTWDLEDMVSATHLTQ